MRLVEPLDVQRRPGRGGRGPGGHEPDELGAGHFRPKTIRLFDDAGDDFVQGGSLPVLHVHAHLDETGSGQVETEGAHSREAAVGFADRLGNGPGDFDVGRA